MGVAEPCSLTGENLAFTEKNANFSKVAFFSGESLPV